MKKSNHIIIVIIILLSGSCRKSDYYADLTECITDNGEGTGTITWTSDHEYLLDGFVFVNDGQTLTIEAGTVIRARTGQGENASALIVARGGRIIARGTPDSPIIFTVEGDDLNGSVPIYADGLWGGLILLGNAPLNTSEGEGRIEGIPSWEPRGIYGGTYDADNSGILKYISVRHGGTNIGEGNEINGLTLAGVGNQTIIEFVEVVSNADDGFEFFGGKVNCRYLISAFCEDDAFDFDLGFQGKGQFFLGIQKNGRGNFLAEHDGGSIPEYAQPYTNPLLYNITYIGNGIHSENAIASFQRNGAGRYLNSIFINQQFTIAIEDKDAVHDSYDQFLDENISFRNSIFYQTGNNDMSKVFEKFTLYSTIYTEIENSSGYFSSWQNVFEDPGIQIQDEHIYIIPNSSAYTNLAAIPNEWFIQVNFKGAFGSVNWARQWTYLDENGFLLPDDW